MRQHTHVISIFIDGVEVDLIPVPCDWSDYDCAMRAGAWAEERALDGSEINVNTIASSQWLVTFTASNGTPITAHAAAITQPLN